MTVRLPGPLSDIILAEAATAYPNECCGLLVGRWNGDELTITEAHPSANVTEGDPRRGFEIDPKLRFQLMRAAEARADGTDIVGHWHSHPDHPAEPSARDLAMVYEPDFVWLLLSSTAGGAGGLGAFRPAADASAFVPVDLRIE